MSAREEENPIEKPTRESSSTMVAIVGLLIFAAFAGGAFWLRHSRSSRYDAFAQCLTAKQVKMYGLYWCTHCAEQERMFGSSFKYVPYIECGVKGSRQEAPECVEAKVKNFPTWEFPDARHEGVLPLKDISERSGCELTHF